MTQTSHIPDPEERQGIVFQALRELVQSDVFRRSARIIRFLEYVVLESLSATPRLTEKTIGIVVFDRLEDWDPKLDPIVRIEARRLREKLGQYYLAAPADKPVVMDLPKGGYKISFNWRAMPAAAEPVATQKAPARDTPERPSSTYDKNPSPAPMRAAIRWSNRALFWLSIVCLAICVGFAAAALSISDYRVVEDHDIRVNSFRIDSHLNENFDGTAIAGKIADQVRLLQKNTRATWTPPTVEDSWTLQRASSWSFRIKDSLRALTRPQDGLGASIAEVSGSIENSGANDISIYIRGDDLEPKSFVGPKNDLQGLIHSASEYIYGACQPSSYSVYLTEHGRSSDALSFTSLRYPKAQHLGDRVQLLFSWATALSQQGNHQAAIEKYDLNIRIAPQSWGSYVALQDEYEALGQLERALDTGRLLESRSHRGSWWFQHLPPRLFRHPGPDTYMATDELTNDYLTLKRSIELALSSRDGGAELLPLYSSYAEVLSRLHERANANLQSDLATSRQDHGAAQGDLLHAKVLLATEEQDDKKLRSVLASYRDQLANEAGRLSLAIEPSETCEIMTAYERAGDRATSDLLSSLSVDAADCLSEKAKVQALRGNMSNAAALFERSVGDAPSIPSLHYDYGLFLTKQGDLGRARTELELAHATGPHWAEPLAMLARLAVARGDIESGLNLYRQAALYAPYWGNLYIAWAEALARDGKKDEAAAKLQSAFSMNLSPAEEADLRRVSSSMHVAAQ